MKSVAAKSSSAKTKAKTASAKARPAKTAAARPAASKRVAAKAAPAKAGRVAAKTPVKAPAKASKGASSAVKAKAAAPVKAKAKAAAPRPAPAKKSAPAKAAPPKKPAPVKAAAPARKKAPPAPAPAPRPQQPPKNLPKPIAAAPVAQVAVRKNPRLANNWKTKPVEQWSDAEVIAMPDDEYMNEPQRAFFRLKLLALRGGILDNAGQTAENLRDDTAVVPDPADRATIEEEHALELRTRDRERKLLKKIEQSIARIDSGDYGYCDETGEPIGVPRLLARPTATLSLEAQQRRELKQKMFGD